MKATDRAALQTLIAAHGPEVLDAALKRVTRWHAALTELRLHCSDLADSMNRASTILREQVDALTRDEAALTLLENEAQDLRDAAAAHAPTLRSK